MAIQIQREKGVNIITIRSDHGKEFENSKFHEFCSVEGHGQSHVAWKEDTYEVLAKAINTTCHITLKSGTNTTAYEIWRGRKPNVQYFHIFGNVCYILVDREQRQKFDIKGDAGIFLGYSRNSRALRVYNKHTQVIMESINVKVIDKDISAEDEDQPTVPPTVELKDVKATLLDQHWINAMQEELVQFERNEVWELVPRPIDHNMIGTKLIFKNKSDEFGNVTNTRTEGVDFEEIFAPVA
ncbi:hypothetical protein LIER_10782 [Lithospermum erythrorhizon]|uniref:Retroviral polymerase SH3-like domain-containing protein n=1 Tax=Lithospermum erythrorhizon TaxID=34254 RepID=A0AAV3PQQ7_LITER